MKPLAPTAVAVLILGLSAAAASAYERWLPVTYLDEANHGLAIDLNSIGPGAQKGVSVAAAIETPDKTTAWLVHYEVQCNRNKLRQLDRTPLDKNGRTSGPVATSGLDFAKPNGLGDARVMDLVCKRGDPVGQLIAARFAIIKIVAD
jgi:hypothetical protein